MMVREELDLRVITADFYSCLLRKVGADVILSFGNVELVFLSYSIFKCGYPNEEIYMHYDYYTQFSMSKHRLYQIEQSIWIDELIRLNQIHPRHSALNFQNDKHYMILFEDEVFECIASEYKILSSF